jgi:hypothetical protein
MLVQTHGLLIPRPLIGGVWISRVLNVPSSTARRILRMSSEGRPDYNLRLVVELRDAAMADKDVLVPC